MKKKLAIDIDGVILDTETLFRVYAEIYDVEINKRDTVKCSEEKYFSKRYDWDKEMCSNFYNKHIFDIVKRAEFVPGADIVLPKLKENYEIIIVTARTDEEMPYALEKFKEIGLEDIKIYNNQRYKIDIYQKEMVDYIIDDDPVICQNAADAQISAIYIKNNASKKLNDTPFLKTTSNWGEIYKYLMLKK